MCSVLWVRKYALDDGWMGRWIDLKGEKPTSGITPAFVCCSFCVLERVGNQSSDTENFLLNASHCRVPTLQSSEEKVK